MRVGAADGGTIYDDHIESVSEIGERRIPMGLGGARQQWPNNAAALAAAQQQQQQQQQRVQLAVAGQQQSQNGAVAGAGANAGGGAFARPPPQPPYAPVNSKQHNQQLNPQLIQQQQNASLRSARNQMAAAHAMSGAAAAPSVVSMRTATSGKLMLCLSLYRRIPNTFVCHPILSSSDEFMF